MDSRQQLDKLSYEKKVTQMNIQAIIILTALLAVIAILEVRERRHKRRTEQHYNQYKQNAKPNPSNKTHE